MFQTNDVIFRQKIRNFDGLINYTNKIINKEIPYTLYENDNIATDKICYCGRYITAMPEEGKLGDVLFWEKPTDKYNYFTSAGKLARTLTKLYEFVQQEEADKRFNLERVNSIQNKINNL
jgi:hypothetical protein